MTVLIFSIIFLGGCATTQGNRISITESYVYTDASKNVVFDSALSALKALNYNIQDTNTEQGYISATYYPLGGFSYGPVLMTVNLIQDKSNVKIIIKFTEPGTIAALDITGSYARYADNFYGEMGKQLSSKGYALHK